MFLGVGRISLLRFDHQCGAGVIAYYGAAGACYGIHHTVRGPDTTRIRMDYIGGPSDFSEGILSPSPLPRPIEPTNSTYLSAGMVNFRDPAIIAMDYRAYIFFSRALLLINACGLLVYQWRWLSCGTPWAVSICELFRSHWPFVIVRATTQTSTTSWEFFTTLEYEWNVFRGRLPYRWTIWVSGIFVFL